MQFPIKGILVLSLIPSQEGFSGFSDEDSEVSAHHGVGDQISSFFS